MTTEQRIDALFAQVMADLDAAEAALAEARADLATLPRLITYLVVFALFAVICSTAVLTIH